MKSAIIYATKTGHSRKIAKAIAKEFNIDAYNIKSNPILYKIDNLFIIGGIYGGKSSTDLLNYVKTISKDNVKLAIILTSSASKIAKQKELRELLLHNGIHVYDKEFTCQGKFLFIGIGHPNQNDIQNAIDFVKIINK